MLEDPKNKINNILDVKEDDYYFITNEPEVLKCAEDGTTVPPLYKVISKCIDINSDTQGAIYFTDLVETTNNKDEILEEWSLMRNSFKESVNIFKVNPNDYPEYFI